MNIDLRQFRALPEAEVRVLLLINAFSGTPARPRSLEGRVKLAKLDFLLRYPKYLARILRHRGANENDVAPIEKDDAQLHDQMIRYRYGPWDPSYFAILGSLIGRGLITPVPVPRGIGYQATDRGRIVVQSVLSDESWLDINQRASLLRRHLDLAGTTLKNLLYETIPEMTHANWHDEVR